MACVSKSKHSRKHIDLSLIHICVSIETAIKEAGLKKSFVASKLGIANTYLKEYLQNPCKISVKNAEIICKLTGKSMNEIDFGQDNSIFLSKDFKNIEV